MTEKFKGYIDEVRVTVGKALYSQKHKMSSYRTRFEILWGAIKNLFTGRGVWLSGRIQANIGDPGLSSETWIRQEGEESLWEHWCVFFDGKKAVGYVNGQEVQDLGLDKLYRDGSENQFQHYLDSEKKPVQIIYNEIDSK